MPPTRDRLQGILRAMPIRWRIMAIAAVNVGLAVVLLLPVWNSARILNRTWADLRQSRQVERLLGTIERDVGRLQVLVHRYIGQPEGRVLERIEGVRATLRGRIRAEVAAATLAGDHGQELTRATESFLAGFDALRDMRTGPVADESAIRVAREAQFLNDTVAGAEALFQTVERMMTRVQATETAAELSYDQTLQVATRNLALAAPLFLVLVGLTSMLVAWSISRPMSALCDAMLAIADGSYERSPPGLREADEIGDMARAVEVFRQNALAKLEADEALRLAKERAERALSDLRDTQASLVEAEKLAALGGLVAGVAHEINNPVGIGLTVASSLTHRCRIFARDLEASQLRRSQLTEFVGAVETASTLIAANLERAGDLVSSFKQVATDRSTHERRQFDLAATLEQVAASLRPGCRNARIVLEVQAQDGLVLDSYPGPLGQFVTNLCLNAVRHGFPPEGPGRIELSAARIGPDEVAITLSDNGRGMTDEVKRRAFEPFFTTRRGDGGTGLGLHIVFNIVTHQLGGRIALSSSPGAGCRFDVWLPTVAPFRRDDAWVPSFA